MQRVSPDGYDGEQVHGSLYVTKDDFHILCSLVREHGPVKHLRADRTDRTDRTDGQLKAEGTVESLECLVERLQANATTVTFEGMTAKEWCEFCLQEREAARPRDNFHEHFYHGTPLEVAGPMDQCWFCSAECKEARESAQLRAKAEAL